MARIWGAKAAKLAKKRITKARNKKRPGSTSSIRQGKIQDRVSARLINLGKAFPGERVRARPGETPQQMLRRMRKQAKGSIHQGTKRK